MTTEIETGALAVPPAHTQRSPAYFAWRRFAANKAAVIGGIVLGICAISVASVMFVIVDLAEPYRSLLGIRSVAMRQALADMTR